jgi:hypothetical protein
MHTLIALTLSGLGVSRQIHGYRVYKNKLFAIATAFSALMLVWFAYAAVWMLRNG